MPVTWNIFHPEARVQVLLGFPLPSGNTLGIVLAGQNITVLLSGTRLSLGLLEMETEETWPTRVKLGLSRRRILCVANTLRALKVFRAGIKVQTPQP